MTVTVWVIVLVNDEVTWNLVVTERVVDASPGRLKNLNISNSKSPWNFELSSIFGCSVSRYVFRK